MGVEANAKAFNRKDRKENPRRPRRKGRVDARRREIREANQEEIPALNKRLSEP
jgi:hypothetical protein